jgi:hypothetical protein
MGLEVLEFEFVEGSIAVLEVLDTVGGSALGETDRAATIVGEVFGLYNGGSNSAVNSRRMVPPCQLTSIRKLINGSFKGCWVVI